MTENNFKPFDVVVSLSGHDAKKAYIVIKTDGKFVYLSDGKVRPLNKLKQKNFRHVKLVNIKTENAKNVLKNLKECAKIENSKLIETLKIIKGEINV